MAGVDGLGGSSNLYNNGVGGSNSVDGAQDVGVNNGVPPTSGANVEKPATHIGGIGTGVAYSQPSPLRSTSLALADSIIDSTNVDITACLVLLMKSANEMRKDQREQWIKQAQNGLQTSNTAADLQKQAAQDKLIADCVSTGIQAAGSVATTAASLASAGAMGSAEGEVSSAADELYGTDADIEAGRTSTSKANLEEEDPEIQSQAKSIIGKEGLTGSSIGGESAEIEEGGTKSTEKSLKNAQKLESERVQSEGGTNSEGAGDAKQASKADAKSAASIKELKKAKAEFKAKVLSIKTAKIEARAKAVTAGLELVGSAGKLAGSAATYASEAESAEASKVKALADFQNTAASDQLDFANQLRDYANAILSTIKDVESARHAASNAIANI